jgi:hypothetical protein
MPREGQRIKGSPSRPLRGAHLLRIPELGSRHPAALRQLLGVGMHARLRGLGVVSVLVLTLAQRSAAQSVVKQIGSDIGNAGKDVIGVWVSPFSASGRDWLGFLATLGAAAAVSPLDDDVDRWAIRNRNASELGFLKELRRGGVAYGGNKIVPFAIVAYGVGVATNNQGLRDGLFGCVASYASASIPRTQILYRLVARDRPDTARNRTEGVPEQPPAQQGDQYEFDFPGSPGEWGKHSAPGGHVANIAACASFLTSRFQMGYVEPVLHAIVGGVGVGRLLDRGHWASDQIVGVVFGYAVGREVARRSLDRLSRKLQTADRFPDIQLTPGRNGFTLAVNYSF